MISPDEAAALPYIPSQKVPAALTQLTAEHVGMTVKLLDNANREVVGQGRLMEAPVHEGAVTVLYLFDGKRTDGPQLVRRGYATQWTGFILVDPEPEAIVDEPLGDGLLDADEEESVEVDVIEVAREIKELDEDKDELEARLKAIKDRRTELEARLIERFAASGATSVSVDGRSVHLHRRHYADFLDKPAHLGGGKWNARDLVPFFKAMNRDELITPATMHVGRLATIIGEYLADGGSLPEELADKVSRGTALSIRVGVARRKS